MKRLNTIIKEIIELENQLNTYNDIDVKNAIDKYEKQNGCTESILITTIYQGLDV